MITSYSRSCADLLYLDASVEVDQRLMDGVRVTGLRQHRGGVTMKDGKQRKIVYKYADDTYDPARTVSDVREPVMTFQRPSLIAPVTSPPGYRMRSPRPGSRSGAASTTRHRTGAGGLAYGVAVGTEEDRGHG
jgi:sRNA-binding regulator protein Hfq